jgi:hypothetical protein
LHVIETFVFCNLKSVSQVTTTQKENLHANSATQKLVIN